MESSEWHSYSFSVNLPTSSTNSNLIYILTTNSSKGILRTGPMKGRECFSQSAKFQYQKHD